MGETKTRGGGKEILQLVQIHFSSESEECDRDMFSQLQLEKSGQGPMPSSQNGNAGNIGLLFLA
jgi:hypothetical protein